MTELYYLTEKKFDHIISRYKILNVESNEHDKLKYSFSEGNYIIDNLKLRIKYKNQDIETYPNFQLIDLFTSLKSKSLGVKLTVENLSIDGGRERKLYESCIPFDFVVAYNDMIIKKSNYYNIPLFKAITLQYKILDTYKTILDTYNQVCKLSFVKSGIYLNSISKILNHMIDNKLIEIPLDITQEKLFEYFKSNLHFDLSYRETYLLSGVGQNVHPDPVIPFYFGKYINNCHGQSECCFTITEKETMTDYRNAMLSFELPVNVIQMKMYTNCILNGEYGSSSQDTSHILTKEHAEMYDLPFQMNDKLYFFNIREYIEVYINLLKKTKTLKTIRLDPIDKTNCECHDDDDDFKVSFEFKFENNYTGYTTLYLF
jgi:hypothetical protein